MVLPPSKCAPRPISAASVVFAGDVAVLLLRSRHAARITGGKVIDQRRIGIIGGGRLGADRGFLLL